MTNKTEMTRQDFALAAAERKEAARDAARKFISGRAPADKMEEFTADLIMGLDQIMSEMPYTTLMQHDDATLIGQAGLRAANIRKARSS